MRHKITLEHKAQAVLSDRRGWTRNICYLAHLKKYILKASLPAPKGANSTSLLIKARKKFFIFQVLNHELINNKTSSSCNESELFFFPSISEIGMQSTSKQN